MMNKLYAERVIQLCKIQAKSFAEMERNMIALARALECLFDIDTEHIGVSTPANGPVSDDNSKSTFMDPHNPKVALEVITGATADVSGKTMTIVSDDPLGAKLIQRFPDGKELWSRPVASTGLSVLADNKWLVRHPSDATEELIERLHEDHGV